MTAESLPPGSVDMRRRILLLVERFPGLHLREVQRRMQTSAMLAEYHLNILERMGLITSEEQGGYRNFFPARNLPTPLDATDKRWLALLRRPVVLRITLALLESGPVRPTRLARMVGLPSSTAMYQLRVLKQAGFVVQGDDAGSSRIRLADPKQVLDLLRAYHPVPDALSDFAEMWARAFQAFATAQAPAVPAAEPDPAPVVLPPRVAQQPGSVQQVYAALLAGPMTGKDICLETGLARRTVYTALQALRAVGLLRERGHLGDMRQSKFWVDPSPQ